MPQDLEALAEAFQVKRKAGTAQAHGSGFGGSGFKFDAAEEQEHRAERKVQKLQSHRLVVCHLIVRTAVTLVAVLQQPAPPCACCRQSCRSKFASTWTGRGGRVKHVSQCAANRKTSVK